MTSGFDDLLSTSSAKISENNLLKFQIVLVSQCQNDLITVCRLLMLATGNSLVNENHERKRERKTEQHMKKFFFFFLNDTDIHKCA